MKTIKVNTFGEVSAQADAIELNIDFNIFNEKYDLVLKEANDKYNELLKIIASNLLNAKDLKTLNYAIDVKNENILGKDGQYRQKQSGYILTHNMRLTFDFNLELLASVLQDISDLNPLINIKFTTKNKDEYIKKAKEIAVKNAINNAKELAEFSNVKIKEIVSIEYTSKNISTYSNSNHSPMLMRASMDGMSNITPSDIKISENVTITFEIL